MVGPAEPWNPWAQFVLTSIVVFGFGWQFHRAAWKQVTSLSPAMDTLISVGTLAAWGYSTLVLFIEGARRDRVVQPRRRRRRVRLLRVGGDDRDPDPRWSLLRSAGERVRRRTRLTSSPSSAPSRLASFATARPCSWTRSSSLRGTRSSCSQETRCLPTARFAPAVSSIDESMLTGESRAVDKEPGSEIFAGTVNQQGRLEVEVIHVGPNTALSQIVRLVEDAQATKAPVQRLADRVSGVFVPVVIAIATVTLARMARDRWRRRHSCGECRRCAHHRLPVCARTRHTDGDHGGIGSRRRDGGPLQGCRGLRTCPRCRHGRFRQDGNPHSRCHDARCGRDRRR